MRQHRCRISLSLSLSWPGLLASRAFRRRRCGGSLSVVWAGLVFARAVECASFVVVLARGVPLCIRGGDVLMSVRGSIVAVLVGFGVAGGVLGFLVGWRWRPVGAGGGFARAPRVWGRSGRRLKRRSIRRNRKRRVCALNTGRALRMAAACRARMARWGAALKIRRRARAVDGVEAEHGIPLPGGCGKRSALRLGGTVGADQTFTTPLVLGGGGVFLGSERSGRGCERAGGCGWCADHVLLPVWADCGVWVADAGRDAVRGANRSVRRRASLGSRRTANTTFGSSPKAKTVSVKRGRILRFVRFRRVFRVCRMGGCLKW